MKPIFFRFCKLFWPSSKMFLVGSSILRSAFPEKHVGEMSWKKKNFFCLCAKFFQKFSKSFSAVLSNFILRVQRNFCAFSDKKLIFFVHFVQKKFPQLDQKNFGSVVETILRIQTNFLCKHFVNKFFLSLQTLSLAGFSKLRSTCSKDHFRQINLNKKSKSL